MTILLDPTNERIPQQRERLPRPALLQGLTIGLLDISKARGNIFLDTLEGFFIERGLHVKRYSKPTFTRVAPVDLKERISRECAVVVEALAD